MRDDAFARSLSTATKFAHGAARSAVDREIDGSMGRFGLPGYDEQALATLAGNVAVSRRADPAKLQQDSTL